MSAHKLALFKRDAGLEESFETSAQQCLDVFLAKGGMIHQLSYPVAAAQPRMVLLPGDAIYPICSGGVCRSQTLWALLDVYSAQLKLFAPHAARYGWDPYNGQINRYRNIAQEELADEFACHFGKGKCERFGFEHSLLWELVAHSPDAAKLREISAHYSTHLFGPKSIKDVKDVQRRLYVVFANNTHVTLYRLNQANAALKDVTVIAIDLQDLVSHPPEGWQTTSRSRKAYATFAGMLAELFDLSALS